MRLKMIQREPKGWVRRKTRTDKDTRDEDIKRTREL